MLSPDAKAIWKSKAGGSLMAALLGSKEPDSADQGTARLLATLSDDGNGMAADKAMFARRRGASDGLAFDRATVRRIDQDGRLHVEITNISKAAVNPYLGGEIPGFEELGLEPDRIYQLLRDPDELEAGAASFNNLPVLSEHVPVSAIDHRPGLVVGSTGTDAVFQAPYLKNSMVVWSAKAIDGIESEEKREISCAYRYVPVMEPGTYKGVRYDGRMTKLVGNHVALVAAGRAGADVVVGDSQLKEAHMQFKPLSRRATLAKGALLGLTTPVLAADARLNLDKLLQGVTAANWRAKKPGIIAAIRPKLAADANIGHITKLLDSLDNEGETPSGSPPGGALPDPNQAEDPNAAPGDPSDKIGIDDDEGADAVDADPAEEILAMLRGKLSDEDLAAVQAKLQAVLSPEAPPAADTPPPIPGTDTPPDGAPVGGAPVGGVEGGEADKPFGGMDSAAVTKLVADATEKVRRQLREAGEAREAVRPYVGSVAVALDSGEAVYKAALDILKVPTAGVHPSAYRAILQAQPRVGEPRRQAPIAQDAAAASGLASRLPGLASIRQI